MAELNADFEFAGETLDFKDCKAIFTESAGVLYHV